METKYLWVNPLEEDNKLFSMRKGWNRIEHSSIRMPYVIDASGNRIYQEKNEDNEKIVKYQNATVYEGDLESYLLSVYKKSKIVTENEASNMYFAIKVGKQKGELEYYEPEMMEGECYITTPEGNQLWIFEKWTEYGGTVVTENGKECSRLPLIKYIQTLYEDVEVVCDSEPFPKFDIAKYYKTDIDSIVKEKRKYFNKYIDRQKIEAKRSLEASHSDMDNLTRRILEVQAQVTRALAQANAIYTNAEEENFRKNIASIVEHKKVRRVSLFRETLNITTKPLYFTEPISERRFLLGEMEIRLPLNLASETSGILMFNQSREINGYSDNMQAPHVFSDGMACWGTAASQIANYFSEKEYYALFLTLLNFLQTVDIDDEAGKFFERWPEVDENNNIICKGKTENYITCIECREECEEDGGYIHRCEDCGEWVCEDCGENYECIDGTERFLCSSCRKEREKEVKCSDCGTIFDERDAYYCYKCNTILCKDCGEEIGDNFYCKECAEEIKSEDENV